MKVKLKANKPELNQGDLLVTEFTNDVYMVCTNSSGHYCLVNLSDGYVHEDSFITIEDLIYDFDMEGAIIVKSSNVVLEEV